MNMPHFDTSISLGNILTFFGMILTFYTFHIANVKRIMTIENRVSLMWNVFKKRFNISDREEYEEKSDLFGGH